MSDQPQLSQEMINDFVVAAHSDLDKVKTQLAEHPALLNENAVWIETPVQAAAHVGNREIAEFLLDQGAPLDICTAAMLGLRDEVNSFLTETPELVNAVGAHNIPLMFFAALNGSTDLAQQLYDAGTPINAESDSQSALHGAVLGRHVDMTRWLMDHDANPYAVDFEGKTAFERAEERGLTEIADILRPFFAVDEETEDSTDGEA